MSDEWIPVVSYSVGALTALLMGALVMRWTLNKLPFSSQLRKSFRTTHRFTAAAIGAMVVLGVVYAIIATSGGFVREGKGGWNPLIGLIQPGMLFAWHPLSMLAGTVIFFPAAFDAIAMRFDSKNQQERTNLIVIHGILQLSAFVVLLLGFIAIYQNKPPNKHFLTLHSFLGLLALGLCALNIVGAVYKSFETSIARKGLWSLPQIQWRDKIHRKLGATAFICLLCASASGLYNKIVLLPDGWGGDISGPTFAWLVPGGTWSYNILGKVGVFAVLVSLFWIGVLGLWPEEIEWARKQK
jgi:hypothetical protein